MSLSLLVGMTVSYDLIKAKEISFAGTKKPYKYGVQEMIIMVYIFRVI